MKHEKFNYKSLEDVKSKIKELEVELPLSENIEVLRNPLQAGIHKICNRLAIQPMEGCDGTQEGAPGEMTFRRYGRFARSGAGLIWAEAVAVTEEGRANPRHLMLTERNLDIFKELVNHIKETSMKLFGYEPIIIMQETHAGRYSKPYGKAEPMIACHIPILEQNQALSDSVIVSDDYLKKLEELYGKSAALAEKAGFDGVDIKACHRYLLNELLGAYERDGEYGGSFENRIRCLCNAVESVKASVSDNMLVTSRMNIYDGLEYPYGFGVKEGNGTQPDMSEPVELVKILHSKYGISLLNLSIGNPYFNPHINRPYDVGAYEAPEHPLEGVARLCNLIAQIKEASSDMIIMSSGNTYLREYAVHMAAAMVEEKKADIIGFGRQSIAYPEFAKDILQTGKLDAKKSCVTCSKCTQLMRAGSVTGCVIRDKDTYMPIYKAQMSDRYYP